MSSKKAKSKRNKGIAIKDPRNVLLPGRRECCCEATKHGLVSNCLNCGRIVCEQEGAGSCFTCGQTVLTRQQRQTLKNQQNAAKQLSINSISDDLISSDKCKPTSKSGLKSIAATLEANNSLEEAIGRKDQMLEFDRNSSVRTKVIDDQSDYFSLTSQNWITNDKRKMISTKVEELHENKMKKNQKILIDLMDNTAKEYSEPVIKDFDQQIENLNNESQLKSDYQSVDANQFIEDNSQTLPLLVYFKNAKHSDQLLQDINVSKNVIKSFNNMRVQDKELMTMSDDGMCLSVNQPYASLLVNGIKRFEGRNWYSAFRGRLWIHSNSKTPDTKTIDEIQNFYSYAGIKTFPDSYPTSSLVGCVTVTDCLAFDEYRDKYPEGDTEANYILVCEDAKQMSSPLTTGCEGNRIYKLNPQIHFKAQKALKM